MGTVLGFNSEQMKLIQSMRQHEREQAAQMRDMAAEIERLKGEYAAAWTSRDEMQAELLRAKAELQQARGGWIRVGDKLPEERTTVLFYAAGGFEVGYYYPHTGLWITEDNSFRGAEFWRPLPEPPKEDA
jgi:hypothetical protein